MGRLERLLVYPIKSLDGVSLDAVGVTAGGGLDLDREYALFDANGDPVTGRREPRLHELDMSFDPETHTVTFSSPDGGEHRFDLADDRDGAAAWLSTFLDTPVTVRRDGTDGFADRPDAGPSVVSTATLREVATWFADITVDGLRRRIRANIEVGGVPAFWEDRFVGAGGSTFRIDGVRFEGVESCVRCVVPTRDPDTGEQTPEFRSRFIRGRRATFPAWADRSAFSTDYTLMLIARIPRADRGAVLRVGDPVTVDADHPDADSGPPR